MGTRTGWQVMWVGLCWAGAVGASEPPAAQDRPATAYVFGAAMNVGQSHGTAGGGLDVGLRPFWSFQWGRFRVATGRASSLLSVGRDTVDPGLSADLLDGGRFRVSGSLRLDKGRDAITLNDQAVTAPIEHTVRGRLNLSYTLDNRWSARATVSQDVLGRKGGASVSVGAQYRRPVSPQTYWDVSVGAQWGTDLYMQSQHGVLGAPSPLGSGWESGSLGLGLTSALNRRWVVYGNVSTSRLFGVAAQAPWVERRTVTRASLGLGYRCCS